MMTQPTTIAGSINAPHGFSASGVFADLKQMGTGKGSEHGSKPDLGLIVSDRSAVAAGVFTINQIQAAPVKWCLTQRRQHAERARAIVANSGNANACTGRQGDEDTRQMARWTAEALDIQPESVWVASTGRIGIPLPMSHVRAGIPEAASRLGTTPHHADAAAQAIRTTDRYAKQTAVEVEIGGTKVRIGGIAKGAGMIHPRMNASGERESSLHATMLCFLTSDAAVDPGVLQTMLERAVEPSFNRITVDGDMSTNDTVLLLANGAAGHPPIRDAEMPDATRFQEALNGVALELAKMMVRDGEGASHLVTVRVRGAESMAAADAAARAVANSELVKTSWCGGDPNWGRVVAALGASQARVIEDRIDIGYTPADEAADSASEPLWALKAGRPTETPFEKLQAVTRSNEFDLHIHLHLGDGESVIYASDLTEAYVDLNKGE